MRPIERFEVRVADADPPELGRPPREAILSRVLMVVLAILSGIALGWVPPTP